MFRRAMIHMGRVSVVSTRIQLSRAVPRATVARRTLVAMVSRWSAEQPKEIPLIHQEIQEMIESDPIVLFMKGSANKPACGFSGNMIQVLVHAGVGELTTFNVLEDPELREAIKEFSDWPTLPQLYIGGEFVGGLDIAMAELKSGELQERLKKAGVELDEIEQ